MTAAAFSITTKAPPTSAAMSRKGRVKENVAGERYDSNAVQLDPAAGARMAAANRQRGPAGGMPDLMSMMGGGGGGMPDMGQMMEMMKGMGGMPGMPGMPGMGGMPGMPPMPMVPVLPKILYPYGLAEGTPVERFFTFYPAYINANKTVQQGRRIPKELACEDPIADEMSEVCTFLKLPHALEPGKKYARDWAATGRVRVRLVREDGTPENPDYPTRKHLMLKMAELIPKLQSRKLRLEKEAEEARQAVSASGAGTAATSSKKKGKKKGRR